MIYLKYDASYDNWKEISFEQFSSLLSTESKVIAVVIYAGNQLVKKG